MMKSTKSKKVSVLHYNIDIDVYDLISCHVINCSKLGTNWFVAKVYPIFV
jgi:hypothetical protein